MILRVCAFTDRGRQTAELLQNNCKELRLQYRLPEESLKEWTAKCFADRLPILFIGAMGIAVRQVAPFVKDKLTDSAVLVMDEEGQFVIPMLSGHVGGANRLATMLAASIGATPVLTTATDVAGVWAVDVFAQKNGFCIYNREGIARISSALLRKEPVKMAIYPSVSMDTELEEQLPENVVITTCDDPAADIFVCTNDTIPAENSYALVLVAKEYVLGVGCRKGKEFEDLLAFAKTTWEKNFPQLSIEENVVAISSVDLKIEEEGLIRLAQYYHVPFQVFSAEKLRTVPGDFTPSAFVNETVGVDNVCERAALCAAGADAELVLKKTAEDGKTIAIAKRKAKIFTW